jgi:hypothetical protein
MSDLQQETTTTAAGLMPLPSRRSSQRHDVDLEVEVTIEGETHRAVARSLSLGGAFIESTLRPAFDQRVQLRFRMPDRGVPIEATATVRWSDGNGFGVQFDGLRAHTVWSLGKYFEQH